MQVLMNMNLQEIVKSKQRNIIFIHVGKCAGGSLLQSLGKTFGPDWTMYRMHVYNANTLIREIVENGPSDLIYLIAARDPISRFISAFNWDKHNMVLSGENPNPRQRAYYEEFSSVDLLARSLTDQDVARAERAIAFSGYAHMGMGQSWYTPMDLVGKLPHGRTFLCEAETYVEDIEAFVSSVNESWAGGLYKCFTKNVTTPRAMKTVRTYSAKIFHRKDGGIYVSC